MMKAYKIDLSMLDGEAREDVSAAIQRHSFRLGYAWQYGGKKAQHEYCPVLCFEANGKIFMDEDTGRFNKWANTEISITDFLALKPEDVKEKKVPEFKPFDKVLVRDSINSKWEIDLFAIYNSDPEEDYIYGCLGSYWRYCIPYEGNEHLLGTTEAAK